MATKKTAVKQAVTQAAVPVKVAAPAKSVRGPKLPATKMTKTQVIRFMAEQMAVPPKQVGQFFDLLIETATAQTKKVGEFTIPGLGKLVKAQRAARMGRNPATGEALKIKAKTTVKFRLAKAAKDAVVPPKA
ncbi:MAG: HU family DNA-binding protein [Janthinobacterium lividum]